MKRFAYPIASVAVALAVGVWAWSLSGRYTTPGLFLVFTTMALSWVVWLLFRSARALIKEPEALEVARASGKRRKELEREKQALLKALKELEFDHEMGKISDSDYQEIGANYRARAVRVMRQLDLAAGDVDYKTLVERDLANRVRAKGDKAAQTTEEKPPVQEAAATAPIQSLPRCPKCGTTNDADAEFCKKCGRSMSAEEAAK